MPERETLPEFTRSLRGLCTARWSTDAEHTLVAQPLLEALKAAHRVQQPESRVTALGAERLRHAWHDAIDAVVHRRALGTEGDRRAARAALDALATPLWRALDELAHAAQAFHAAMPPERDAAWRGWCDAMTRVAHAADDWWEEIVAHRAAPPVAPSARWRRLLRFGLVALTMVQPLAAQHLTFRVPRVPVDSLQRAGFDVVAIAPAGALVVADPAERARLEARGWRTELIAVAGRAAGVAAQVGGTPRVYRPFDDPVRGVAAYLDSLARNNARVRLDTIGRSVEGRPLLMVKVGPRDESAARPNVLLMATYHAREWMATEMALRLLARLATATDARIDSLTRTRDIWILPVANPDGYQFTFTSNRLWRKNRARNAQGAVVGVDLNRNHTTAWGIDNAGSSPTASSEIYRGPAPASEPETQAIERFHAQFPPAVSVSYHTFAGLLLYPPGVRYGELSADLSVYRALAGTNLAPAVVDGTFGSSRRGYSPTTAWMLYTVNGDFMTHAAAAPNAISFTPELTSGYRDGQYYGFEAPDDETFIQRTFLDNLPFALDLIESARDPVAYRSPTTLSRAGALAIEAVSPMVRVRTSRGVTPSVTVDGSPLAMVVDTVGGGAFQRRWVSSPRERANVLKVDAGGAKGTWRLLARNGAEPAERTGWLAVGVTTTTQLAVEGTAWTGTRGELRTPPIAVPITSDTVSLLFWTRHQGDGFNGTPLARVRLTADGGVTWRDVELLTGSAPLFYPMDIKIGGVRGRTIQIGWVMEGLPLWLDEISVVAQVEEGGPSAASASLAATANPVRGDDVGFVWPWTGTDGTVFIYDAAGRLVWKSAVAGGSDRVVWPVRTLAIPNGVYLVVATSAAGSARLKLFVAR
ncbi:MAG: hypothetical protein K2X99_03980 [Gemmatimonadaceae bacterium]|nr:hypothetical protein [Gemmatimonadaceae bacterium]